ncbi:MAG: N-6 DNA methylase [Rikenellaceae bacterium]
MEFNRAYSRETFVKFLEVDFLPQDFIKENTPINITHQTNYIQEATKLGVCSTLDLVVYEVKHSGKHDPRVGLSKESFKLLAQEWQGKALIAFIPMDNDANYRFSYISIDLDITEQGKIKRLYSNPRRYSYYLGDGIACHTPNKYLNSGRVKDPKDLQDRFSVEVLTRAFYNELSDWYAWAIKIVRFPNQLEDKTDDDKYNHEAVIRLVTRLIFVWFLKQKHLIPAEFFDEKYIADNLMSSFNPYITDSLFGRMDIGESKYYKGILQNLFFAMLNSPITSAKGDMERRFIKEGVNGRSSDFDNKKLMRYKSLFSNPDHFVELANRSVPFLNGGLFDCLDDRETKNFIDCFSDNPTINKWLIVPDYLFFGDEVGKDIDLSDFYGDKKKKKVSARGIIDILKRYNFTVEENTPFDQEVSLDPELLGKVFENLLAMYNPETKATARKQTGSFYTPREIVQYMVDESLVAHLKRTVGEDLEDEYRRLMRYTDEELSLTDEQKRKIINSLHDCKILDPACGSGAFPMGVLQQMVHILSRLDESNEIWKEILLDDAADETRTALKYSTKEERTEAMADIERSFDESINRPDYARKLYLIEKCIYGVDIQSIAIQISKLRFFISLVIDQRRNTDPTDNFGIRPLPNLEAKFVAANTLIGLNKTDTNLFDTPEVKVKEEELKVANHKIFGAKTFKTKTKYRESVRTLRAELSDILLQLGYVSNDTAQLLKGWDMFDQNASSPFFDPEWMFGIHDGFDIVIGNPPYVLLQNTNISDEDKSRLLKLFYSAQYKVDLYNLFIEKGVSLLSNKGIITYITPISYLKNKHNNKLRELLFKKTDILTMVRFFIPLFDNASVDNAILISQAGQTDGNNIKVIDIKNSYKSISLETFRLFEQKSICYPEYVYNFDESNDLLLKIAKFQPLKTFARAYFGIQTYDRKLYVSKDIVDNSYMPVIDGGNIQRYYIKQNSEYVCFSNSAIKSGGNPDVYNRDRIVVRQIGNYPEGAICKKQLYTLNTIYNIFTINDC